VYPLTEYMIRPDLAEHQDRNLTGANHRRGRAADNELPDSGMTIRAHYKQVDRFLFDGVDNHLFDVTRDNVSGDDKPSRCELAAGRFKTRLQLRVRISDMQEM